MRYFHLSLLFILILLACKEKSSSSLTVPGQSLIIGEWKDYPDGWLYIENVFSGIEDSVYVKNGKFTIPLKCGHSSYYYYLWDDDNFFTLYMPSGDSLMIEGLCIDGLIQEVQFAGRIAPHNRYLDYLISYLDSRNEKMNLVFEYASYDSLLAFNQRESLLLNSKLNELLPSENRWEDSLFVKLEKKRMEWMQIRDLCDFPKWYYWVKKESFADQGKIDEIFKKQDLNDTLLLWVNESSDALSCYFLNEYHRITKQWKEEFPDKDYFLTDYWNYSLSKYGFIPVMKLLVPYFLYNDVMFRTNPTSIHVAKAYFKYYPQENFKNKYLKRIITSIEQMKQGQPAPDFSFMDIADTTKKYSLKDFEGKNMIIEFGSTSCSRCIDAAQKVSNEFEKIKSKTDLSYVYILVEEASDRITDFAIKNKFPYSVCRVSDISLKTIHSQYSLFFEPRFVWIDKQGNLKDPFFYDPWQSGFWTTIEKL